MRTLALAVSHKLMGISWNLIFPGSSKIFKTWNSIMSVIHFEKTQSVSHD